MNNKGFTLIELIIAIAIIAILAALSFTAINPGKRIGNANDDQRVTEARSILEAIDKYTADNNSLPPTIDNMSNNTIYMIAQEGDPDSDNGTFVECADIAGQIEKLDIDLSSDLIPNYLSTIPADPLEEDILSNGSGYYIIKNSNNYISIEPCNMYKYNDIPNDNLLLVLRTDSIDDSVDSDSISTWYDSSINNNNFTSTIYNQRPRYKTNRVNGKPSLMFDGQNDRLSLSSGNMTVSQPLTFFIVNKIADNASGLDNIFSHFDMYNSSFIRIDNNTFSMSIGGHLLSFTNSAADNYNILTLVFNGSSSEFYQNGLLKISGNMSNADFIIEYLGNFVAAPGFDGDLAEVIVYNTLLTDLDRETVEEYLSRKYAIALE